MKNIKQVCLLTRGLPASGKSTYAKELCDLFPHWKRVNKDDLRSMMLSGEWDSDKEKSIIIARDALIRSFLSEGFSVVVDDTNIQPKHVKNIFDIVAADFPHVEFEVIDFNTSEEDCVQRDKQRTNQVGEHVVRRMAREYAKVDKDAWKNFQSYGINHQTIDSSLPNCIIVDIDGTVAERHRDRSPFEWDKVGDDHPKHEIIDIVKSVSFAGMDKVIFMSGRDEVCRDQTQLWLNAHFPRGVFKHEPSLFMRAKGDMRKDYIVKRELFEQHVRGKYNVFAVFDDRDQVVNMWRKQLGLTCLQVDYGKF